jgi:hypothetical protein
VDDGKHHTNASHPSMEAIEGRERPASDPKQRVVSLRKHKDDWELSDCEQASSVSEIAGDL